MNAVTVRELRPEDKIQAAEVDRLATDDLRTVYRPTDVALRQRSALASAVHDLVAVVEEQVVGVVQYRTDGRQLWLRGLGVHPNARRRGVAAAVVQRLERIARDCGCVTLTLHTVRETGNVEIFERLGFVVESEGPTNLFESERYSNLSEVVMRKALLHGPG
jgi:GNAT superfamily N-acetyltransferase